MSFWQIIKNVAAGKVRRGGRHDACKSWQVSAAQRVDVENAKSRARHGHFVVCHWQVERHTVTSKATGRCHAWTGDQEALFYRTEATCLQRHPHVSAGYKNGTQQPLLPLHFEVRARALEVAVGGAGWSSASAEVL